MVEFFLGSLIWKILKLLYNLIQISLKFDLRYFKFTQNSICIDEHGLNSSRMPAHIYVLQIITRCANATDILLLLFLLALHGIWPGILFFSFFASGRRMHSGVLLFSHPGSACMLVVSHPTSASAFLFWSACMRGWCPPNLECQHACEAKSTLDACTWEGREMLERFPFLFFAASHPVSDASACMRREDADGCCLLSRV